LHETCQFVGVEAGSFDPAVDDHLRGIDPVASDRAGVGVLACGPFGLGEGILPAEPIPVVDGENEREDVGPVPYRSDIGHRRRAVRSALALEEFDDRRMHRVGRERVLRQGRKRREAKRRVVAASNMKTLDTGRTPRLK
jgi:hypothetical protein